MDAGPFRLPLLVKRIQRQTKPGAVPGTIAPHPDEPEPIVRAIKYNQQQYSEHEIKSAQEVSDLLSGTDVVWVDVDGLGNAMIITQLGEAFGLHPLSLEDVVNVHQRPKLESYGKYLFVIARAQSRISSLETEQIAIFLGLNWVVTFHQRDVDCLDSVYQHIRSAKGKIRSFGADYLMYAVLDAVIDGYFPALERYGERLDALDDEISSQAEGNMINQIHNVRSELLTLRRSVWPLRDAINSLNRDSGDLIKDETRLYLRDCYDHTVQIIDVIETDRELCADLRDFYLTVASNRMNQVMKFLTIIATLFIPLSFIAGLYGMNFNTEASKWNMPELNWTYGYEFALLLMTITAALLLSFFARRGWLR